MGAFSKISSNGEALRWYMSGQVLWFFAYGIQVVAFQAIGALVLNLSPSQMGLAQASVLIPALFFTLPGGVLAERRDGRLILIAMQGLAALPAMALGYMVLTRYIEFHHLILFGLAIGGIGSFVLPARDALLSHIVDLREIQRAVNIALGLQFCGMLGGMVLVSSADFIDIGWMPIAQSAVFLAAALVAFHLPRNLDKRTERATGRRWAQMIDGVRAAMTHKDISPVLILQFGISIFYIGMFLVILPILVRDYYQGGAGEIALLNMLFWTGTIISMIALLRIGLIAAVGKLLASGISTGLLVIGLLAIPKPFWMLCGLCVLWGVAAGCSMSSGRTIIQNRAPNSHRARILSVYQLSFMGGAPLGALMAGLAADWFGPHRAPLFSLIGMAVLLMIVAGSTRLLNISLSEEEMEHIEETTQLAE